MNEYSDLIGYCQTASQTAVIHALNQHGTHRKASQELGISRQAVSQALDRVKRNAAQKGFAPDADINQPTADGYSIKGTSTLYGEEGEKKLQWIKTDRDAQARLEALEGACEALREDIPPSSPVKITNPIVDHKLVNMFMLTDYHIGMNAWGEETGADWDIKIAEDLMVDWFDAAIDASPPAHTAVFAQLGDFLHWDGIDAVTPGHGHILEGDTRTQKLIRVALRVTRRVIQMLLESHDKVHIIMAEGNHDLVGSMWLRESLRDKYSEEPRVTVDCRPSPYYCYEHGKTTLFFHHGHKRGPKNLDHVFASRFREEFGRTTHSYGHTGHLHSDRVLETNLMLIEQHRTLASPDSYAARGGWSSGRSAKVITYHSEYGEVGRVSITPEMVSGND